GAATHQLPWLARETSPANDPWRLSWRPRRLGGSSPTKNDRQAAADAKQERQGMIAERQPTSSRGLRARPLLPTILGVCLGVPGGLAVILRCAVLVLAFAVGCGGKHAAATTTVVAAPRTPAEQILALLPQGAQVVVEIDLARLRDNPVVGP